MIAWPASARKRLRHKTAATAHRRVCTRLAPAGVPPSPQPGPRPAGPARNGQREACSQAGHDAGLSSNPEASSGPRRGLRGSRGMIGACIAALPVRPDVHVDTGRNRGPEQRCRCQSPGDLATWQVVKYLPGTQALRPAPPGVTSLPRWLPVPAAQEGCSIHLDFSRPAGQRPRAPGAARRCPPVRAAGTPRRTRAPSPGRTAHRDRRAPAVPGRAPPG